MKVVLTALALLCAASPAAAKAADALPAQFRGVWCIVDPTRINKNDPGTWIHTRVSSIADCRSTFWLKIRANSTEGQDGDSGPPISRCKIRQVVKIKTNDYLIKQSCGGYYRHFPQFQRWVQRITLKDRQLILGAID
ncbi:MAG TPA: hypothetical protein VHJ16_18750 [Xanthobacteraceae bacterium]|nr:hypothetical protein [Xanthobacteraceae bacterium]